MASLWTTEATDAFTRTENPLAGGWTTLTGETAFKAVTDHAEPSNLASDAGSYYSGRVWADDQSSSAIVTRSGTDGSGAGMGLSVRCASGARTYYRCVVAPAAGSDWEITRFNAGVNTSLDTFLNAFTNGDRMTFRASGSVGAVLLEVLRNGTVIRTFNDTSGSGIGSGSPGLSYSTTVTAGTLDDWEGGELVPEVIISYDFTRLPKKLMMGRP